MKLTGPRAIRISLALAVCLQLVASALVASGHADIIDRIAVSVGNQAITASDVEREVRVTAFLNRAPARLAAAAGTPALWRIEWWSSA